MSIAPSDFPEGAGPLRPIPSAREPSPQADAEALRPQQPGAQPGDPMLAGVSSPPRTSETSFTKLIAQLTRQLKGIELTFRQALTELSRRLEKGAAATGQTAVSQSAPPSQATNPYDGLIRRAAEKHELDPALLTAVVRAESGFDPKALSSAGAMGLMQLMPDTARSLGVRDPYNPGQNIEGGATLLRGMLDRYSGRLDLALAAYNAGSGAVDEYGGVPPYAETRRYVDSILADYRGSALGA